jgi:cytochrome c peroxidase
MHLFTPDLMTKTRLMVGVCWVLFWTSGQAASLQLSLLPHLGDEPLVLDQVTQKNAAGEGWSVTRLSYFISGLSLQRADGQWHAVPDFCAWMNAGTDRHTTRVEDLPAGDYQALRFHVGLDPQQNASDPAVHSPGHPLNPNLNGLHWSWQGGYIFMALEGHFKASADARPQGYAFHLARDAFRTAITLPHELSLKEHVEVSVRLDVAAIIHGGKAISFVKDGSSTHSKAGDPLALALQDNLAGAFHLLAKETGASEFKPSAAAEGIDLPAQRTPLELAMAASFPKPALPPDNPLFAERIALGRMLFHETALSRTNQLSCASCHAAEAALSDPRRFSVGVEDRVGHRHAMPLFNLAWKPAFFWDGRSASLRQQVLVPIQDHREMDETLDNVVAKLAAQPSYAEAFKKAFGSGVINAQNLALALESFLLTLTSYDSKFDRAQRGEVKLTELEQQGFELFMTEREPRLGSLGGDCFHCHGGALFTDHQFRNNGLAIDETDLGHFLVSQVSIDRGAFSTPSLRNIALTAPYMHDGRFATLEQVLDHYSEGVERTDTLDPNLAKHPDGGLHLSPTEKQALIAFLKTLTDDRFAR